MKQVDTTNVTQEQVTFLTPDRLQVECAWCWQEQHQEEFPEAATSTICETHTAVVLSSRHQSRRGREQ